MRGLKTIVASYSLSEKLDSKRCLRLLEELTVASAPPAEEGDLLKVSAVHMGLSSYPDLSALIEDCQNLIALAVRSGSQLVVFPHLSGLLPLCCERRSFLLALEFVKALRAPREKQNPKKLRAQFLSLCERMSDFIFDCYYTIFQQLARRNGVYIAAGSSFLVMEGVPVCRSFLFPPSGEEAVFQDKLTRSPKEALLGFGTAKELRVFDTTIGRFSILTDTDIEFFECCKLAKGLGAEWLVNPAFGFGSYGGSAEYPAARIMAAQQGLHVIRSGSYCVGGEVIPRFGGVSGIYGPPPATRSEDGIIMHTAKVEGAGGVLSGQIDLAAPSNATDPYTYFRNAPFYKQLAEKGYPTFLSQQE